MATFTTTISESEPLLRLSTPTPDTTSNRSTRADPNHTSEYLTSNSAVTGREPNTNPSDWPTLHRRVPPHRPPQVHPDWVEIGGPLPMRLFLWNMFSGCRLLQVRSPWMPIVLLWRLMNVGTWCSGHMQSRGGWVITNMVRTGNSCTK